MPKSEKESNREKLVGKKNLKKEKCKHRQKEIKDNR